MKRFTVLFVIILSVCLLFSGCELVEFVSEKFYDIIGKEDIDENPDEDIEENPSEGVGENPDDNPPHTHSYTSVVTAPTETEKGYTTYTCDCGESYVSDFTHVIGYFSQGFDFKLNEDETGYVVMGIGECADTDLVIPSQYNGLPVVAIGNSAFYGCDNLTKLTISDSVISIGSQAFRECSGLISITIGKSVTNLGSGAFSGCKSLENIYFNATAMNDFDSFNFAFMFIGNSKKGVKVTIGSNVTKIPAYLFGYMTAEEDQNITIVEFESGSVCQSIGNYAFFFCNKLTSITIPDSVTSIGYGAFDYCYDLTSVTIPNSVTSIGDQAFYCSGIESVVLGSGVSNIGKSAFSFCQKITNISVDSDNQHYQSIDGNLYTKDGKTLVQYAVGKK